MQPYIFNIGPESEALTNNISTLINNNLKYDKPNEFLNVVGSVTVQQFSDGEMLPTFDHSIRNSNIYLVSSLNTSDDIVRLSLAIDAAKRSAANKITCVIPYMGYMRQDRRGEQRTTIGAKTIIKMLEAVGCDHFICVDLHAEQIEGFFNVQVDNIRTHKEFSGLIKEYINNNPNESICLNAPDSGGSKRVDRFWKELDLPNVSTAFINKKRDKPNSVGMMELVGDVKDKTVFIIDDMIDTAGTLCKAADMLIQNGAKKVMAIATHAVLSGKAYENIANSQLSEVIVSNTINRKASLKIKIVDVTSVISKYIYADIMNDSPSNINLIKY